MFKNIWDSHSALSEESDIYSLTFVRWNRREEFSPWNCILLTLQEAIAHLKLEDAEGVTIDWFLRHASLCVSCVCRATANHFERRSVTNMQYRAVISSNWSSTWKTTTNNNSKSIPPRTWRSPLSKWNDNEAHPPAWPMHRPRASS